MAQPNAAKQNGEKKMPIRPLNSAKYASSQYYVYTTGFNLITSGATPVFQILTNTYDFMVEKFTGSILSGATIPPYQVITNSAAVLLQMTVTSLTEQVFSTSLPFNDAVGTATLPSIVRNLIFPKNVTIAIQLSNNTGVSIYASFTMIGQNLLEKVG